MKTIQTTATDKENLVGRLPAFIAKEHLIKPISIAKDDDLKHKKPVPVASSSSQTLPASSLISEADLTSEGTVSDVYWEVLAEKRRLALEESLEENEYLHGKCDQLESELNQSKHLLDETRELVNVLTEMLQEKENAENERTEDETRSSSSQQTQVIQAEEALAEEFSDTEDETDGKDEPQIIRINGED